MSEGSRQFLLFTLFSPLSTLLCPVIKNQQSTIKNPMPLNPSLQPYRDYQLAKRFVWDPQKIELTQDQQDWAALTERERDILKKALAIFGRHE